MGTREGNGGEHTRELAGAPNTTKMDVSSGRRSVCGRASTLLGLTGHRLALLRLLVFFNSLGPRASLCGPSTDEVDRLERKVATMNDMYGKNQPKPLPPSYTPEELRLMRAAEGAIACLPSPWCHSGPSPSPSSTTE